MKRVLEWRKVASKSGEVHLYWREAWVFRLVRCGGCGNEWWETTEPPWAPFGPEQECACGS